MARTGQYIGASILGVAVLLTTAYFYLNPRKDTTFYSDPNAEPKPFNDNGVYQQIGGKSHSSTRSRRNKRKYKNKTRK